MIGSALLRGGFVFLSGATPLTVLLYEILFEAESHFHHSNWKLPDQFENRLNQLMVTPQIHEIHQAKVKRQTDSNYSVIFSAWDRLHCTLDLNKPLKEIVIGVPSYSNPAELTSGFLLKLPFTSIRPWNK